MPIVGCGHGNLAELWFVLTPKSSVPNPTVVQALATPAAAPAASSSDGNLQVRLFAELTGLTVSASTEDEDTFDCVLKASDGGESLLLSGRPSRSTPDLVYSLQNSDSNSPSLPLEKNTSTAPASSRACRKPMRSCLRSWTGRSGSRGKSSGFGTVKCLDGRSRAANERTQRRL